MTTTLEKVQDKMLDVLSGLPIHEAERAIVAVEVLFGKHDDHFGIVAPTEGEPNGKD